MVLLKAYNGVSEKLNILILAQDCLSTVMKGMFTFRLQQNLPKRLLMILSALIMSLLFSGCVARKDTILPIRSDREMLVSMYKSCVTQATTNGYDKTQAPEDLVRASLSYCKGERSGMLRDYPQSWRTSLLKEIDDELYQSEIQWVLNKRK